MNSAAAPGANPDPPFPPDVDARIADAGLKAVTARRGQTSIGDRGGSVRIEMGERLDFSDLVIIFTRVIGSFQVCSGSMAPIGANEMKSPT